MKKGVYSMGIPLLLGLAGALLRGAERKMAYESSGLVDFSHPLFWCLWGFLLAAAVFLLVVYRPFREKAQEILPGERSGGIAIGMTIGGLLVAVGGLIPLFSAGEQSDAFDLVLSVLGIVAGAAFLVTALGVQKKKPLREMGLSLVLPVFWAAGWGIYCLWSFAVDPVLDDYMPEIFAILLVMLALMQLAGFAFKEGQLRRTMFFISAGVVMILVTVLGPVTEVLLFGGERELVPLLLGNISLIGGGIFLLCAAAILQGGRPAPEEAPVSDETFSAPELKDVTGPAEPTAPSEETASSKEEM